MLPITSSCQARIRHRDEVASCGAPLRGGHGIEEDRDGHERRNRSSPRRRESSQSKAATIYDVAQAAGVSHQTVSRFLKGFEGIRPETREKVVRALDELEYRPNLTARSLKSGRSHRIGALTHEISKVGPSRVAEGATAAAREAGYVLDLVSLDVRESARDRGVARTHHPARPRGRPGPRLHRRDDPGVRDDGLPRPGLHRRRGGRRREQPPVRPHERGHARAHRATSPTRPPTPRAHRRPRHVVGGAQPRRGVRDGGRRPGARVRGRPARGLVGGIRLRRDRRARAPPRCDGVRRRERPDGARSDARPEGAGTPRARRRERRRHRRHPRVRLLRPAAHDAAHRLRGRRPALGAQAPGAHRAHRDATLVVVPPPELVARRSSGPAPRR